MGVLLDKSRSERSLLLVASFGPFLKGKLDISNRFDSVATQRQSAL